MNRRSFISLAPLILVPEPRRAYSFLWERPPIDDYFTACEKAFRDAFARRLGGDSIAITRHVLLLPRGHWRVIPGDFLVTKTIELEFVQDEPRVYEAVFA